MTAKKLIKHSDLVFKEDRIQLKRIASNCVKAIKLLEQIEKDIQGFKK
jgi:hypothetical protein